MYMILTQRIAEQFLSNPESINLSEFTSIEEAAARSLGQFDGYNLSLDGLTTLSEGAARGLSRHEGELRLNGLKTLGLGAAKGLSRHKGDLVLDGLITLSEGAAKALSQIEGRLYLGNVTSLSDVAAQALAPLEGCLFLKGTLAIIEAKILKALEDAPQGLLRREISVKAGVSYVSVMTWLQSNCSKVRTEGHRKEMRVFLK